jgi:hypothetical protein
MQFESSQDAIAGWIVKGLESSPPSADAVGSVPEDEHPITTTACAASAEACTARAEARTARAEKRARLRPAQSAMRTPLR